jgi:hypothetical protein
MGLQILFSIIYGEDHIIFSLFLSKQAKIIYLISRNCKRSLDIVVQLRMSSYINYYHKTAVRSEFRFV